MFRTGVLLGAVLLFFDFSPRLSRVLATLGPLVVGIIAGLVSYRGGTGAD